MKKFLMMLSIRLETLKQKKIEALKQKKEIIYKVQLSNGKKKIL